MNDSNDMFNNNNDITQNNMNMNEVNSTTNVNSTVSNNVLGVNPPTPQPTNNDVPLQQNYSSNISTNDEDLLKAFIGNNYDKITTRPFNFAAFFFSSLYMCYRKMFGYGILTFLVLFIVVNVVNAFSPIVSYILSILLSVVVGFIANKIYLSYAKKKVAIIKASNSQKSNEELKAICAIQGGTSVGKMFGGLFVQFCIALVAVIIMGIIGLGVFVGDLFNNNNNGNKTNTEVGDTDKTNSTLLQNVDFSGYSCVASDCKVYIGDFDNSEEYILKVNNNDFFMKLNRYRDYIKTDIYYNKKGDSKTIVDYKIYLKSTNEDISNVSTESELRDKIGLFLLGTHTETMTLKEIGDIGFGSVGDESYVYTNYTFVDSKNNEYEMKFKNDSGSSNLTEGNQYTVTFEVSEGSFHYDYNIQSIK